VPNKGSCAVLEPGSPTITKDSFIDEALAEHYSDLFYRVEVKTSKAAYIYLLFEHKSATAPRVALDLLRYLERIWEFLGKRGNKTPLLPAILPLQKFPLLHNIFKSSIRALA
jgi:predicted transposase YdaD